jgi:hypothetical protein
MTMICCTNLSRIYVHLCGGLVFVFRLEIVLLLRLNKACLRQPLCSFCCQCYADIVSPRETRNALLKTSWEFPPSSDTFMRSEYVVQPSHLWKTRMKVSSPSLVCNALFPHNIASNKYVPYFWFLWRIFFSLWLFVEFVFLETRQTTWLLTVCAQALKIDFLYWQ